MNAQHKIPSTKSLKMSLQRKAAHCDEARSVLRSLYFADKSKHEAIIREAFKGTWFDYGQ
jgi:hypothetical protein